MSGSRRRRAVPWLALSSLKIGERLPGRPADRGAGTPRKPHWLPVLRQQLSEARVAEHLSHLIEGKVVRYELPGIAAFNFVCEQALGGGGMASLRNDPLGKGMGQILLAMPVKVPKAWFEEAA